jgi:hypothetical protein
MKNPYSANLSGAGKNVKNTGGTNETARQTGKPITAGAKTPGSKTIRLAQVLRRKGQQVKI